MSKKTKIELILFTLGLLFFLTAWTGYTYFQERQTKKISDFATCSKAGFPILESFPEQCRTSDGRIFTRELAPGEYENVVPPPPPPPPSSDTSICEGKCGNGICEETVCEAEGCPCAETAINCPADCPGVGEVESAPVEAFE